MENKGTNFVGFLIVVSALVLFGLLFAGCDDDIYYGGINNGFLYCPIDGNSGSGNDVGSSGGDGGGSSDGSTDSGGEHPEPPVEETCEGYLVCHYPGPNEAFTICVGSDNALIAHMRHGDLEGGCNVR